MPRSNSINTSVTSTGSCPWPMHYRQPPPAERSARGKPDGGGDVSGDRLADPAPRLGNPSRQLFAPPQPYDGLVTPDAKNWEMRADGVGNIGWCRAHSAFRSCAYRHDQAARR